MRNYVLLDWMPKLGTYIWHLFRMPPGPLPGDVCWVYTTGRRPLMFPETTPVIDTKDPDPDPANKTE